MKATLLLIAALLSTGAPSVLHAEEQYIDGKHSYIPPEGFVPNEETAVRIAEAVWRPIYGATLDDERPFRARLIGEVWHASGTLPEGMLGGVAEAEINQKDGKILRVSHGK